MGTSISIVAVQVGSNVYENQEILKTVSSPKFIDILRLYKIDPPPCKVNYIEESLFIGAHQDASDFQYGHLLEDEHPSYQIVLVHPKETTCFSIYRTEHQSEAEELFKELEDVLLSHIDAFVNFLNPSLLTSLIKLRRNHPTWSLKKVVDYLKVPGITVPEPVKDEVDAPVVVRYTKQDSQHQHETIEMIEREQPSFARDFFGTTSLSFLYDNHPELISSLISAVDGIVQTGKDLKDGIDNITKYTESPIHVAIRLSQETILKMLLDKGADPLIPCGHAYPGHLAMKHQSKGCLKLLMDHDIGAVMVKDKKYKGSLLHWAKNSEQIDLLANLKDLNVNTVNKDHETALHIMVKRGRLSPAISLICHGVNVDVQNKDGSTALHYAVKQGDLHLTRALLLLGANFNLRDNEDKTPKDYLKSIRDADSRHDISETFDLFCYDEFGIEVGSEIRTQSILKEKTGMESLLSLDGGGIRGLVLAELLLALESIAKRPIYDLFDWSSGTSTGSYLAVSVANHRSVRHCQYAYLRLGRSCFVGIRPYSTENVDQFLIAEFGNETVIDEITFPKIMVPAVLVDRRPARLHLFRNYDAPYDEHYQAKDARFPRPPLPADQLLWLAIRSSCSAPSYFRSTGRYLDGGLIANNPTLDAMSEIHKYNKFITNSVDKEAEVKEKPSKLRVVVSLGTGCPPTVPLRPIDLYRPSSVFDTAEIVDNLKSFMDLMVDQVTNADDHIVDRAQSWCEMTDTAYYRFSPTLSKDVELNETDDRILLEMLCDIRKGIIKNMDQMKTLAKILLGEEN